MLGPVVGHMEKKAFSHSFDEAVLEELAYIYERDALAQPIAGTDNKSGVRDDPFEEPEPSAKDRFEKLRGEGAGSVRKIALHDELPSLNGLSLSGGGIRSASFCLGTIEGLSELGMLNQFHYVSSVSGGGYAASWLAAWSYREPDGVIGVQRSLSEAATSTSPPDQVRHLSRYVTYLAPRAGALSADLWSLISAYMRNLAITLSTTLPGIACIVALPLLAVLWAAAWRVDSSVIAPSFEVCIGLLVVGNFAVRVMCEASSATDALRNALGARFLAWFGPMLGGFSFAVFASVSDWRQWATTFDAVIGRPSTFVALLILVAAALTPFARHAYNLVAGNRLKTPEEKVMLSLVAFRSRFRHFLATPVAVAIAGAVLMGIALMLQLSASKLMRTAELPNLLPFLSVTFGPLAWCAATTIGEYVFQAIVNRKLDDGDREWMARFSGLSLTSTLVWTLLCAAALLAPALSYATSVWWYLIALLGALAASRYFLSKFMLPIAIVLVATTILSAIGFVPLWIVGPVLLGEVPSDSEARLTTLARDGLYVWWGMAISAWLLILLANVNRFSMHALYRDRLVRTFLGASRDKDRSGSDRGIPEGQEKQFEKRSASPFHDFDPHDNPQLNWLKSAPDWRPNHWMPVFIINAALNRTWQSIEPGRVAKASSFTFTPFSCGSALTSYCNAEEYIAKEGGLTLGTAMATSGAALSSRSGRYDSRILSFFLTLMNLRLGNWLGNPSNEQTRGRAGPASSTLTLLSELLGGRAASQDWIHLSDGGHFENLGTYELLRRGCSKIIAIDSSADPDRTFEDLANLIRLARDELNVSIEPYSAEMKIGDRDKADGAYATIFSINYPEGPSGRLLYIKPCYYTNTSIPVPIEIQSYAKKVKAFPHEPTVDQFFSAEQFDAYRRLARHQIKSIFAGDAKAGSALREFFRVADENIHAKKESSKYVLAAELDLDGV